MQLTRPSVWPRADVAAVGALAAWAAATAAATLVRPGELLELALIGAAAMAAWGVLAEASLTVRMRALGAVVFFLPLLNTWPARSFFAMFADASTLVQAALAPSTLLLAAFLLLAPARRPARASLPYVVPAVVLVVAAFVSSLLADNAAEALRATLHTHALPVAAGIATAASIRRARDGWALVQVAAIAAAVPALVGAAAYVLNFGIPLSGADLVAAKIALVRPHLFQEATFGNVGHLADLALLLLPAAVLSAVRHAMPRWLQIASGLAAAALLLALVLTASRGALAVGGLELLVMIALLAHSRRRAVVVPAVGLAMLAVVALSPALRSSYGALLGADAPQAEQPEAGGGTTTIDVGPVDITVGDTSAAERADAVRTGLELARDELPFGVGTGQYGDFDETYTAPHSLAVEVLAENGPVALVALLAVAALLLVEGVRTFSRRGHAASDVTLLRGACTGGTLGLLLHGVIAGAPLTIGPVNVWAAAFWIQVGVVAGLRGAGADAE